MKPYPPNTPPSRLREERLRRGLTQVGLACLAGVASSSVSKVERAPMLLRPAMAEKLAAALGVPAADLLHRDG